MVKLGNEWDELLKGEFEKPYYLQLRQFLKSEYEKSDRLSAVFADSCSFSIFIFLLNPALSLVEFIFFATLISLQEQPNAINIARTSAKTVFFIKSLLCFVTYCLSKIFFKISFCSLLKKS